MKADSLEIFLRKQADTLLKGPVALIFAEDEIGLGATLRHHARIGFENIILLARKDTVLPADCVPLCHHVENDPATQETLVSAVNKAITALEGRWLYYCYNGEYLHFPFCETRSINELITFITEERRSSAFTYVIDLYAADLDNNPYGYSLEDAHLDSSGYYALNRWKDGQVMERQLSIYGGLKWRFEEHLPWAKRRIDRVALFCAKAGLQIDGDQLFNDEEYNTYQCPWHHSVTIAICSFRTAKYLKSNPGSTFEVNSFAWSKSQKFRWNSQQLMDLGLMEPGQWF
ncbi:glycosyltransferase family 2 protein [Neptunicoccus sediminis]|uniref:glycosyltransferase family 2 protein n=1 Tax=Neptunicoccus sediminis TaxID=1892596 RepID=UPI0008460BDC|nr:glycosyltransferase family 2 protein [Neptunicoccus sediminis]